MPETRTLLDLFATSTPLFVGAIAVLGVVVGSFLNVVIHRLPLMLEREWRAQCAELAGDPVVAAEPFNLVLPRSHCPACGHVLGALENIPLVSYLLQRGRCRACGTAIPLRYPLVEALSALAAAAVAWRFGLSPQCAAGLLLTWLLIPLAVIDLRTLLLPDAITLPGLWAGLACALLPVFADLPSAVIGAMAGYGTFWAVYWLVRLATGREGMGRGDFKLLAILGAWLGWQHLATVVLLSAAVGAAVGLALIALGRHAAAHPLPYGPYLAGAGWIALLGGDAINAAYLRWAGF